ncbi:hypothetical protein GCM10009821_25020 [Aeromicrobium halocynthiae]|uniref:Uncharacterized protein n=1 Tax=Aeromicrobium halocynthiae TaxID=560557 RepID=A0ABN2W3S7_9ACTN
MVVLGLVVGLHGAVVHRLASPVVGVDLPWGLLLALVATGLVAWAAAVAVPVGAAWFGLGWTLALVAQQGAGAGSYLVAGDALGWTFMGGGLALIVAVAARLSPQARPAVD